MCNVVGLIHYIISFGPSLFMYAIDRLVHAEKDCSVYFKLWRRGLTIDCRATVFVSPSPGAGISSLTPTWQLAMWYVKYTCAAAIGHLD